MDSKERINAQDAVTATLIARGAVAEQLQVKGRYTARCVGPIESRRAEFNALRERITAEEDGIRARTRHARRVFGLFFRAKDDSAAADRMIADSLEIAQLRAELEAIPTEEKWSDVIENVVATVGKNALLDAWLGNAAGGTFAMGLKSSGTAVAADTMTSHASWTEVTNIAARLAPSFSAASGGSKATSATVNFLFTSGASVTVAGVFLVVAGSTTVSNTTGTLFSAGDFSGGNKIASSGDTVQVTYSLAV